MRNAILLPRRFRNAITPVSFWQKAILLPRRFAIASGVGWVGVEIRYRREWHSGGGGGARLRVLRWRSQFCGVFVGTSDVPNQFEPG
ncbi:MULTISPECIES: hypothetical protein [Limnospira]|uniref:hypothetical protein n=1 Tax=Limnospira TaxID=2596745 RepID=UPI00135F1707|nr:hypothetical protein HFV01_08570 [Limnospira fusiformis SAG 85.79]